MMPRDILTTVLQRDSAWYVQCRMRRRMQLALDASIRDVPIPMHAQWENNEICCVCERLSEHYLDFLFPRQQGSETYTRGRLGLCDTCARVFRVHDSEREFKIHNRVFVAWETNARGEHLQL
jgi:hypothetical protein